MCHHQRCSQLTPISFRKEANLSLWCKGQTCLTRKSSQILKLSKGSTERVCSNRLRTTNTTIWRPHTTCCSKSIWWGTSSHTQMPSWSSNRPKTTSLTSNCKIRELTSKSPRSARSREQASHRQLRRLSTHRSRQACSRCFAVSTTRI